MWGFQLIHQQIAEGGRYDQRDDGIFLFRTGLEWVIPGTSAGPRLQVYTL